MKQLLFFFSAMLIGALCSAADYSGTWLLDKSRSGNLPPFYSQVKMHKLTNVQTDAQLTVDIDLEGPDGPDHFTFVYQFDGAPSHALTDVRTPSGKQKVPTTMTTRVAADGKVHIDITREFKAGDRTVASTSSEDWSLSPDGHFLTVRLVRQNIESELVFARQ